MLNDFKPEVAIIMRSDETIKEFNLENEITINHTDKVSIKNNQISIQNEFVGDN